MWDPAQSPGRRRESPFHTREHGSTHNKPVRSSPAILDRETVHDESPPGLRGSAPRESDILRMLCALTPNSDSTPTPADIHVLPRSSSSHSRVALRRKPRVHPANYRPGLMPSGLPVLPSDTSLLD